MRIVKHSVLLALVGFSIVLPTPRVLADNAKSSTTPTASGGEQVEVDSIKKKYWARGEESEMGVVQNRTYSKAGKLQLGVTGGLAFSDPFLNQKSAGGLIGYHFTEIFGFNLLYWKYYVSPSAALLTFQEFRGATTNTNNPIGYYGLEASASPLYGKLSLIGKKIIYYDFFFLAGFGITQTETGNYKTPSIGLGQRFFISQFFALRADYHLMQYHETIVEKTIPNKLHQPVGERDNLTNSLTIGIEFYLGKNQ